MVWFPGHTRTSGICSIALLCLQAVLPLARAELVHAVFEVAEGDDKGSCDGLEDLNDIFEEALDMAEAAYDGINGVIGKESSRTTRKALYMMFDIDSSDYHNDGKKLPRLEKAGMLRAQQIFEDISTPSTIRGLKPKLYCDSSYLIFTKNAYDKNTGEKTDLPITDHLPDAVDGAYWDPNQNNYVEDPISAKQGVSPCDVEDTGAFTAQNSIVICPGVFDEFERRTLYDVKDDQSLISEGETLYDTYKAVSGAFLHELTHLIAPGVIIDQPSFDSSGQEEPDELSYGFSSCSNLAAVDLTKALQNADTYHVFAMMMYLGEWDWTKGRAAPYEE